MGQYYCAVNFDKRERLSARYLRKLVEQIHNPDLGPALLALLAIGNGLGGGDLPTHLNYQPATGEGVIGRWAGDRVALVGDYAKTDVPWREFEEIGPKVWPSLDLAELDLHPPIEYIPPPSDVGAFQEFQDRLRKDIAAAYSPLKASA